MIKRPNGRMLNGWEHLSSSLPGGEMLDHPSALGNVHVIETRTRLLVLEGISIYIEFQFDKSVLRSLNCSVVWGFGAKTSKTTVQGGTQRRTPCV
eukprot:COSAG02_NODE_2559_length_8529_cov_5.446382_2_plen_95_part_00